MDNHKLFVGNMAARITQRDLWRFFSTYGLIDECAKFHESYAFIRFVYADDAERARQATNGALLKGRKLKVEFAANVNKKNSSSVNPKKFLYIEPLRRTVNIPSYYSPLRVNTKNLMNNRMLPTDFSNSEKFLTPDFLQLAGIQSPLATPPDDGYETNSSPLLKDKCHSRFFPITINQHSIYSNDFYDQNNRHNEDIHFISLDFARMPLFSDLSSNFGDDSTSFTE